LLLAEFGLYVDKHGDPSREFGTIEWEGTAKRVALHHPYVLLFDTQFIEIRHVDTGRLAQIIRGNDVRCLWDRRQLSTCTMSTSKDGQELLVHGVMGAMDPVIQPEARPSGAIVQHVFELIPTISLHIPG
jgi:hypothetical protein